jgi:acetyltransferase-like isoleucine patch superfamily enzyme
VKIGNGATLKSGTYIGDNSIFDDNCISTGACWIGKNVNIRTGAIISKANIIEDGVFIGPGVVTNHTKHVTHLRPNLPIEQLITYISYGSIIGSQASLLAGVYISPNIIIGGGSVVVKSVYEEGVYIGSPLKRLGELPPGYRVEIPNNAGFMYMDPEILDYLKSYIPNLTFEE